MNLVPVWKWQCFGRGNVNIEDPPPMELTDEEQAELKERLGVGEEDMGQFTMKPTAVTCPACKVSYSVLEDDEEVGDE